ncbi:MAG: hypothetical protein R6X21_12755 [Candidatus Aminicenantes bacterium]
MRVTDWNLRETPDAVEVSADVDGFRLCYRLPKGFRFSRSGDPFLAASFLPAMLKGEPLEIDPSLPVSPMLLENISRLQEIHHSWNPVLKMIPIHASTAPAETLNGGAFSFFSGGVDSMFTFLKRLEEISHVVFIHGFDFVVDQETFRTAEARNSKFAAGFGKTLIPVETNTYPFSYLHNMSRKLTHGSALASVALLLGFSRAYVPSSYPFSHLLPWGSHPLTDPLYSNEGTRIIQDGAEARRVDKVIRVAECDPALANLTVCFSGMNVNCGRCVKCVRTMIPLAALGAKGAPFPSRLTAKAIKSINWGSELFMLSDNIELAAQKENKQLLRTLKARLRKHERAKLLKEFDQVFLRGMVLRQYRRFVKLPPWYDRVYPTPPDERR